MTVHSAQRLLGLIVPAPSMQPSPLMVVDLPRYSSVTNYLNAREQDNTGPEKPCTRRIPRVNILCCAE